MAATLKVYYWPMLARGAPLVRMLEHTGTPYEYISEAPKMGEVGSFRAGAGDVFAPPIVVDGDFVLSQSVATAMYIGKKCDLTPPGFQEFKAVQYMLDIVDVFENGFGKNNEQGPTLKKYLEGERWPKLMGNLERGIQGPFYFGAEPSCVDFFLLGHLDWREPTFEKLRERFQVDPIAAFPKVSAIGAELRKAKGYKEFTAVRMMNPVKDEVLDAYNS